VTRPPRADALQAIVPRATYRVQLHAGFRFADAQALLPYLDGLGISHLYCSPFLRARAGSLHGYDVVDHGEINPEIGGRADFDALVQALHERGMGLLADVVPNHMGVLGGDNAWWLDVLENGAASAFAQHFDIDWQSADPLLTGRVLLPMLLSGWEGFGPIGAAMALMTWCTVVAALWVITACLGAVLWERNAPADVVIASQHEHRAHTADNTL